MLFATIVTLSKQGNKFTEIVPLDFLSVYLSCLAKGVKIISINIEQGQEITDGDEDLPF